MNGLDRAIKLAVEIHSGQVDKGGNPYILHPLRVMLAVEKDIRVSSNKHREDFLCVAVLHDVVEDYSDSKYNINEICNLVREFGYNIYKGVMSITRLENETWNNYIRRVMNNPIARFIKILDLEDNMDLTRLKEPSDRDLNRNVLYLKAKRYLETGKGKL